MTPQQAFLVRSRLTPQKFMELDAVAALIAFEATAVKSDDRHFAAMIASRRSMLLAYANTDIAGSSAAACLLSDFFVVTDDAALRVEFRGAPEIAGALAWRIGDRARRLLLSGRGTLTAPELLDAGIADALVARGEDSLKWLRSWIGGRSLLALSTGAGLIRSSRPEVAERSEFARLFASGEPQHGLKKFLEKQPAGFEAALHLEIV